MAVAWMVEGRSSGAGGGEERRRQREGARGSETDEQRCEADGVTGTDVARGMAAARRRREMWNGGETRRGY